MLLRRKVWRLFYSLFKLKRKRSILTDRSKKKQGFSTFLRGCNPVPALFVLIANGTRQEHQISPLSAAKVKQFFTKQKIRLLLTAKIQLLEK